MPLKPASLIQQHALSLQALEQTSYTWTMPAIPPFEELLISWNADRPRRGHYVILSSVSIQNRWSPWLLYAVWGSHDQYSFHDTTPHAPVRSFQDQIELQDGKQGTGFRIRIEVCGGANLENFYKIYACTCSRASYPSQLPPSWPSCYLPIPGLSQMQLHHPRSKSFCSPTSTTAVIQYALKPQLNPLTFAEHVYDAGFDIYGNWSFNIAQAFVELGKEWQCFYARSLEFDTIGQCLRKGLPVVVSVKGKLTNSPMPYNQGHLLVIKGYEASTERVLCMDPAFPSDEQTSVAYPWEEFMQVWRERGYLTYFFFCNSRSDVERFGRHSGKTASAFSGDIKPLSNECAPKRL